MTEIRIEESALSPALCVDDGGTGKTPVVFVHSLAGNSGHWSKQLEHLRGDRRAIAFDLRGHGRSDPARDNDYSFEAMANDIYSVVRAAHLEKIVLVGHSMGGSVSIAFAGRYPEMVAGLFLADPSGDARQIPGSQFAPFLASLESDSYSRVIEGYWSGLLEGSSPAVRERVLADLRSTRKEVVVEVFRSSLRFDPLTPLRGYPGRKLSLITSLNDTPISLHNLLPELPHDRISGTGHWLQLDRPREFNRKLDDFIK